MRARMAEKDSSAAARCGSIDTAESTLLQRLTTAGAFRWTLAPLGGASPALRESHACISMTTSPTNGAGGARASYNFKPQDRKMCREVSTTTNSINGLTTSRKARRATRPTLGEDAVLRLRPAGNHRSGPATMPEYSMNAMSN